jgi:hypothetical protein|tara:strand:+ start:1078 stop:1206 length:129 start_codon:yes stop_codon:yes gene_type:complete
MNDFEGEKVLAELATLKEEVEGIHEILEALLSEESSDYCVEE